VSPGVNYQDTVTEPVSREVDNCAVGKHDGDEDEYNGDNSHGILSGIDKVRAFVFIVLSTNVTFYSFEK
jgi:hypothetical protein